MPTAQTIDEAFTAKITTSEGDGAWTYVVMPRSGEVFGTRRPVKVAGEIDGTPFEATLLPLGDGTHMVPLKAALRRRIGKSAGEAVTVQLSERRN